MYHSPLQRPLPPSFLPSARVPTANYKMTHLSHLCSDQKIQSPETTKVRLTNEWRYTQGYRDRLKGVQILLSNSQAGPGRKVKQEQEEISRNHVQTF